MEVLNFLKDYWHVLGVIGGLVVAFWRLTIMEVKSSQVAQTKLLTAQISAKFNEITGENNVIKAKLESLCQHVERQNGRIGKCEDWQLEHTEHFHSK